MKAVLNSCLQRTSAMATRTRCQVQGCTAWAFDEKRLCRNCLKAYPQIAAAVVKYKDVASIKEDMIVTQSINNPHYLELNEGDECDILDILEDDVSVIVRTRDGRVGYFNLDFLSTPAELTEKFYQEQEEAAIREAEEEKEQQRRAEEEFERRMRESMLQRANEDKIRRKIEEERRREEVARMQAEFERMQVEQAERQRQQDEMIRRHEEEIRRQQQAEQRAREEEARRAKAEWDRQQEAYKEAKRREKMPEFQRRNLEARK